MLSKNSYQEPFMEICEQVKSIDNNSFSIRLVRLIIRYTVRIFGYKISIHLLANFQKRSSNNDKLSYILYLLNLNRLRLENILSIKEKGFLLSIDSKISWAEYQLTFSKSLRSRLTAKKFLKLLADNDKYNTELNSRFKNYRKTSSKKFYIFGPNSDRLPNNLYNDFTLVLPKPIEGSLTFSEKILFLNSIYYNNKVISDPVLEKKLLVNYNQIFVSCKISEINEPFKRSKFPLGDNLCSAMGLGRILYNLLESYGKFTCIIEGFDFYLKENSYKKYYPSLIHENEYQTVKSLYDHDPLFNFLYVKELLESIELIDSFEFKKILSQDTEMYLKNLSSVREYRLA